MAQKPCKHCVHVAVFALTIGTFRHMNPAMARLEVVAGRAIGMSVLIDDELLIGRHAEGAGRLADDEEISRSHARLSLDRTGFCAIEDLGSTNGTYVNGLRIKGPETLSEGDTIEVGATTLVVRELPIPHSEHTLRAIPSRPTDRPRQRRRPGAGQDPAGRTPPCPCARVPAQQSAARGQAQGPVTTESARSKAGARRRQRRVRCPTTCPSSWTSTGTRARPPLSVGDDKPVRLVLDGDTWRPVSDVG